ncbi:alpha-xenorhabdolysin family binary toxin subunit A [Pseudomonas sp. RP23018S]|uniref:alpha-xenorhabdolysin family binary toxin subunit A n=1 Tax=Pseudomonas sp. RP23018S TaxID=3096037 RepID=UPI002ACC21EF|nr:alpha-xenorhabdolysin family binary toxin subunit A [Pseudomonas sp. RP23018S]
MAELDGVNQGGLTLSREHIITLNRYANHVLTLPTEAEAVENWLGYSTISEPTLMPSSMAELFVQLRAHGLSWRPLSDNSRKLASQLSTTASSIAVAGAAILEACGATAALGPDERGWEAIVLSEPVALDTSDKAELTTLSEIFPILLEDVRNYGLSVDAVSDQTKAFRDTAAQTLIPAVYDKRRSVLRERSSDEVESLRQRLVELDNDIKAMNSQYDQYVQAALSGLAAGPIGVAITGGIYGSMAEQVRKRRNQAQEERRSVSEQLKRRIKLEGSLEELTTFVDELKSRLDEVVVASSHLHTAWESVDAYVAESIRKLDSISNRRQLALFSIYFKQFLAQWAQIKNKAEQLTQIFDEASVA